MWDRPRLRLAELEGVMLLVRICSWCLCLLLVRENRVVRLALDDACAVHGLLHLHLSSSHERPTIGRPCLAVRNEERAGQSTAPILATAVIHGVR